jgi:hypothetical protein
MALLGVLLAPGSARAAIPVEQDVSHTAVWPGDRFRYSITITVPAGGHLAREDFDRKNLDFAPLVVDRTATETLTLPNGATRVRFDYFLSNYETGNRTVELPRIVFRFQPTGQAAGSARPATEEMAIPALPIAVRSTLNQPLSDSWIVESLAAPPLGGPRWPLVAAGVVGLLVSSIPAWAWLRVQAARWRARRSRPTRRQFLDQWARSFDDIGTADGDVRERFLSLETLAREYVRHAWNLPAEGLTAAQLGSRLEALRVSAETRAVLTSVVDDAQHCRYAPPGGAGWEERFRRDREELKGLAA